MKLYNLYSHEKRRRKWLEEVGIKLHPLTLFHPIPLMVLAQNFLV